MPRLYSSREVLTALSRAGFTIVSQKGSHIKLNLVRGKISYTVIVPNHKQIAQGTFGSILKQANLDKQEFEKLLR